MPPPNLNQVNAGVKALLYTLSIDGKEVARNWEPIACPIHSGALTLNGQTPPAGYNSGFSKQCQACAETAQRTIDHIKAREAATPT